MTVFGKLFATAFLAAGLLAGSTSASTLDFNFTFTTDGFGDPTVTGIVRGLLDNGTSAAGSVEVFTNTDGFGLGEYVGNPLNNTWTVSNGLITTFSFTSFGANNTAPDEATCCSLSMASTPSAFVSYAYLSPDPNTAGNIIADLTFTPVSSVPVPAGLPLLMTALAGLVGLRLKQGQSVLMPRFRSPNAVVTTV